MADKTKDQAKVTAAKPAPKAPPKPFGGFGEVNPKVKKALRKTPTGFLERILGKATPRKGSSK